MTADGWVTDDEGMWCGFAGYAQADYPKHHEDCPFYRLALAEARAALADAAIEEASLVYIYYNPAGYEASASDRWKRYAKALAAYDKVKSEAGSSARLCSECGAVHRPGQNTLCSK